MNKIKEYLKIKEFKIFLMSSIMIIMLTVFPLTNFFNINLYIIIIFIIILMIISIISIFLFLRKNNIIDSNFKQFKIYYNSFDKIYYELFLFYLTILLKYTFSKLNINLEENIFFTITIIVLVIGLVFKIIYLSIMNKYFYGFEVLLNELEQKEKLEKDKEFYSINEIKEKLGYKENNLELLLKKSK